MGQMHRHHQEVRDRLVAFVLKVMLGQPEHVIAMGIHRAGNRLGLGEHRSECVIVEPTFISRCRVLAHVRQINMASIDRGELADHRMSLSSFAKAPTFRNSAHFSIVYESPRSQ